MAGQLGLIASLPQETLPTVRRYRLRRAPGLPPTWLGTIAGREVRLVQGGVGAQAATRAAEALLESGCTVLISFGFAAGLTSDLAPGDLREVSAVVDVAGTELTARPNARLPVARLVTVAAALGGAAEKAALAARLGVQMADMETLAVARTAEDHGCAWSGLRAVSDAVADELPSVVSANTRPELGRVRVERILLSALVMPTLWPALVGLARRSRLAGDALAAGLMVLIEAMP